MVCTALLELGETFWNNFIGTPFDKISNTGQCVFTVSINLSISALGDDDLISIVEHLKDIYRIVLFI